MRYVEMIGMLCLYFGWCAFWIMAAAYGVGAHWSIGIVMVPLAIAAVLLPPITARNL